jgi:hypothetical protein
MATRADAQPLLWLFSVFFALTRPFRVPRLRPLLLVLDETTPTSLCTSPTGHRVRSIVRDFLRPRRHRDLWRWLPADDAGELLFGVAV